MASSTMHPRATEPRTADSTPGGEGLVFSTAATSRSARASCRPGSAKRVVYRILRAKGPLTDRRLEYWAGQLGVSPSGARGRRAELVRDGKVKPVGVVRLPNGRLAICWGVK